MGIKRIRCNIRQVLFTDEIRVDELAYYFSVSRQTINNWLKSGILESRSIKDVIELIKQNDLKQSD